MHVAVCMLLFSYLEQSKLLLSPKHKKLLAAVNVYNPNADKMYTSATVKYDTFGSLSVSTIRNATIVKNKVRMLVNLASNSCAPNK